MSKQNVGELVYKITGDSSGLKFELLSAEEQSKKSAKKSGDAFSKLKSQLLGLGIGAIITRFFTDSIKAASDAEETAQKFSVVYKDIQKDAADAAKNLADNYLLSRTEAKKLLADTGDLLTGFGFAQDAALGLSSKVQTLAADLASFSNVQGGVTFASEALTKGLFGETEQLKTLGIVISQNSKEFKDAIKIQMQSNGLTLNQAKAEVIFAEAKKQSGNAIGDVARSANSYANQQRRLEANLINFKEEIGTGILPALRLYQKGLIDASKAESGIGKGIGEFIGKALIGLRIVNDTIAVSAQGWISEFLRVTVAGLTGISEILGALGRVGEATVFSKLAESADNQLSVVNANLLGMNEKLKESKTAWEEIGKEPSKLSNNMIKGMAASGAAISDEEKKRIEKLKEESKKFISEINTLNESEKEKTLRVQQEQLSETQKFRDANVISEKQASDLRVKINEDASRKILEINIQQYEKIAQQAVFATSTIAGFIGQTAELYSMQSSNRIAEIENEKTAEFEKLNSEYEANVAAVESSLLTQSEKNEALKALDEQRARDEKEIDTRRGKEARKIQREAAERQRALSIAQTGFSIPEAAFAAFKSAQVLPFPASVVVGGILAAAATTFGLLKIKEISKTPLPALAAGGLALGPSIVGEAGRELAVPLDSDKGRAAIDEFSQGLTRTGGNGLTKIDLRISLNGGEILYRQIESAIKNGQLIIEEGSIST